MPGPAPAKVQHYARRLSFFQKQDVTPVWDEEEKKWIITITEKIKCDELIHLLLHEETGESYTDCSDGHDINVVFRFRRGGYRQGLRPWRMRAVTKVDSVFELEISAGDIRSLLSQPTAPHGEGKASGEAAGSTKQQMNVKRTTVIRV